MKHIIPILILLLAVTPEIKAGDNISVNIEHDYQKRKAAALPRQAQYLLQRTNSGIYLRNK